MFLDNNVHRAIEMMRRDKMNDTCIACVICDIHAWATNMERQRTKALIDGSPPSFPTLGEIETLIQELRDHGG